MSAINTDTIKSTMTDNVNTYMMNTHYLNDYNEIYNVNNYLDERTLLEKQRLEGMYDRLNSNLLGVKQEYLLRRFDIENYKSKINIILFAFILTCVLLICVILFTDDAISQKLLLTVIGVSIVFFTVVVYIISKSNSFREKTNWNMYYWGPIEKKK
jgi:glycerol uptake facilitator-like aquaporin